MKKILVGLIMAGSLAISGMAAEKSGVYMGVDIGVGKMKYEEKSEGGSTGGPVSLGPSSSFSKSATDISYGIKGGYKHFINDNFGFRSYGYLSYSSNTLKANENEERVGNFNFSNFGIGVGVDALYNIIENFGVFAGVNLGLGISSLKLPQYHWFKDNPFVIDSKDSATLAGLDGALNLGVRTVLADMHGIELGVSVPFGSRAVKYQWDVIGGGGERDVAKGTITRQTGIKLSYLFNF